VQAIAPFGLAGEFEVVDSCSRPVSETTSLPRCMESRSSVMLGELSVG
jgi:hypothetical protein